MKGNLKYDNMKLLFLVTLSLLFLACNKKHIQNSGEEIPENSISLNDAIKPTGNTIISTIKTIKPDSNQIAITVNANGFIAYDTRTFNNIASRYDGRIEKLYIKYNFQSVEKGEKLFEIYSPEIITAQQNLIYLLKNDSSNTPLLKASENKLLKSFIIASAPDIIAFIS